MRNSKFFQWRRMAAACCVIGLAVSGGTFGVQAADVSIDDEKALEIALADAGVQEGDVQRLDIRYEKEDGESVLEVEFTYDKIEYEYVLRESDGAILEWSVDGRDVGDAVAELTLTSEEEREDSAGQAEEKITAADGGEIIGIGAAKEIVLQDSGIPEEDAVFTAMKFEYNGRYYDYEIEVSERRSEYEYKLDAETGEILEAERD